MGALAPLFLLYCNYVFKPLAFKIVSNKIKRL